MLKSDAGERNEMIWCATTNPVPSSDHRACTHHPAPPSHPRGVSIPFHCYSNLPLPIPNLEWIYWKSRTKKKKKKKGSQPQESNVTGLQTASLVHNSVACVESDISNGGMCVTTATRIHGRYGLELKQEENMNNFTRTQQQQQQQQQQCVPM